MSQEVQIALIAAGAALVGALLATAVSLFTASVARRTTLEDREAAVRADESRWEASQVSARKVWLRDQKQQAHNAFMDAIDETMTIAKSWNAATPREQPPQGEEQVMETLYRARRLLNELMLLDSVALDPAGKILQSLYRVVLFIEEVPGKLTPEVNTQFMETMSDYNIHFAHYLLLARLDLGITELTVQKTSEAPST